MCNIVFIEDIDLTTMFVNDWSKYSKSLEKEVVKLEIHSEDVELLYELFRLVHRIKLGSSFIGMSSVTRLSNEIEFVLDDIRNQKLIVDTELVDSLLSAVDFYTDYTAKLSAKLVENDCINEDGLQYLNVSSAQDEKPILEKLRLAREKCQSNHVEDNLIGDEVIEENEELEILQSDEFKKGLAEGIKEQFLYENFEHIERIENDILMALDANSDDREAVNEIFRAVHSIKGGTGIYLSTISNQGPLYSCLKSFSEVVHTFESLLTLIRDKGCKFEKDLVDLSLSVMDYFKLVINSIASDELNSFTDNGIHNKIKDQILCLNSMSDRAIQNNVVLACVLPTKVETPKLAIMLPQTIRVNQEKIDKMMNTISELLIAKNSFLHISSKLNLEYNLPEMSKEVKQTGEYVNRISDELQNTIMSIRMMEVKTVFQKMPRVVRDIAQSTEKKMELFMEGDDTEIDKTIIEQISDPLVHLIRNAADHGIENPEERLLKGKPEKGRIVLRAYNKNKYVYIEIEDDGKGIDADKMKEKAIEKGFITKSDADRMSRNQLVNLIFLPGFSTAKKVTEVSGRGVGMDIVKSNITKIKGNVTIESEVDKGSKMIIQLPLTLAVSRGLIVEVSGESYIFPLEYILETVKIKKSNIHCFNAKCFTYLRGEVIAAEWLCKIFLSGEIDHEIDELNAVIIANGADKYAIIVDKLKSQQEFVVKTLEGQLAAIPGISGSTLLGNGKVVLIVNPPDLLQIVCE